MQENNDDSLVDKELNSSSEQDESNDAVQAGAQQAEIEQDEASADESLESSDDELESDDESARDNEDNSGKRPRRLPKWAKDRLERSTRQVEELQYQLHDQRKRLIELEESKSAKKADEKIQYDPQTQIVDPFSGQVVPIDSVEGRVIIKLQQAAEIQVKEDEKAKKKEQEQKVKDKLAKGLSKFEDYKDVVVSLPFTQTMLEAAALSDVADEFVYHLGKYNREEVERIVKLSPAEQFKEIVLLESKFKQMKKPANPTIEPPTQVKSSGYIEKDPERMSFDDLKALRRKQRGW